MEHFRDFSRIFMIVVLGFTALTQLLRMVGLVVDWPILNRLGFTCPLTKFQLFLYYVLATGACIYSIIYMYHRK